MKKLIIILMLLMITLNAVAPNLSQSLLLSLRGDVIKTLYNQRYEEKVTVFIDYLGFRESRNTWTAINSIDCFGEFQFSYPTLQFLGYGHITPDKFKTDPSIFPRDLQVKVLRELIESNEQLLVPYMNYIGTTINNVVITKAGLLAGSHLGGVGSVRLYLTSDGVIDKQDIYGTKISDYIKEFSMFNL